MNWLIKEHYRANCQSVPVFLAGQLSDRRSRSVRLRAYGPRQTRPTQTAVSPAGATAAVAVAQLSPAVAMLRADTLSQLWPAIVAAGSTGRVVGARRTTLGFACGGSGRWVSLGFSCRGNAREPIFTGKHLLVGCRRSSAANENRVPRTITEEGRPIPLHRDTTISIPIYLYLSIYIYLSIDIYLSISLSIHLYIYIYGSRRRRRRPVGFIGFLLQRRCSRADVYR